MRNRLSKLLGKLLCVIRREHAMGKKFTGWDVGELKVWYKSCVICDYTKQCSAPKRRVKQGE